MRAISKGSPMGCPRGARGGVRRVPEGCPKGDNPSDTPMGDSARTPPQMVTPSTCNVCTAPPANGTATVLPLRNRSERAV